MASYITDAVKSWIDYLAGTSGRTPAPSASTPLAARPAARSDKSKGRRATRAVCK